MNKVFVMGRLTGDPIMRYANSASGQFAIARYSLAVEDPQTKEKTTYFFDCIAMGKAGEFAEKYLHKGMKILVEGKLQSSTYDAKDGTKRKAIEINVSQHEFAESKQSSGNTAAQPRPSAPSATDSFVPIPDDLSSDDLPFG